MKYTRYYTVDKVDVWVACPRVRIVPARARIVCVQILWSVMECNG